VGFPWAWAWLLAAGLTVAPSLARADVVVTWMNIADQVVVRADENNTRARTPANSRSNAQVALAMFEAVNAVEARYRSYLGTPSAPAGTSAEAAAAAAAHTVLAALFPDRKKLFDDALTVTLARVADGPGKTAGVDLGRRTAAAAMARAALPAGTPYAHYRPEARPGEYIDPALPSILPFDLLLPPFFLARPDELRPAAPPALASKQYARDLDEVKRLGGKDSSERPADKTLLARAWLRINYSAIVGDVARQPGRSLSQNARMYALCEMAAEETWLAVKEAKLHFRRWRPITAIRNADQDGNDDTPRDEAWEPLLRTPPHPEYPCGHCGYATTVAAVLEAETGPAPAGGVTLRSYEDNPGMAITMPTWKAFVDEMALSRIYAGAHVRSANEAAQAIGREVARRALAGFMQLKSGRPSPPAR
jgi:PAP2 superfamily